MCPFASGKRLKPKIRGVVPSIQNRWAYSRHPGIRACQILLFARSFSNPLADGAAREDIPVGFRNPSHSHPRLQLSTP
jgi:hypothetical protein